MRSALMVICLSVLAACGVETAGSVATAAALKEQEIEQGKAAMERVQRDLEAANQQMAQRAAQAEEATK